jgi:hypothetical protein
MKGGDAVKRTRKGNELRKLKYGFDISSPS